MFDIGTLQGSARVFKFAEVAGCLLDLHFVDF